MRTIAWVTFFHLVVIGVSLLSLPRKKAQCPSPPLRVHTVMLEKPKPKEKESTLQTVNMPHPKIQSLSQPSPPQKKASPKKSSTPSKKETAASEKDSQLVSLLEKSLKRLNHPSTSTPSHSLKELASEKWDVRTSDYTESLVSFLQKTLILPESGPVRLELLLTKEGKVERCSVTSCTSKKNATYVAETLPKMHFPPFGRHFPSEKTHAFPITLFSD